MHASNEITYGLWERSPRVKKRVKKLSRRYPSQTRLHTVCGRGKNEPFSSEDVRGEEIDTIFYCAIKVDGRGVQKLDDWPGVVRAGEARGMGK
jgi:hypothetical protein